MSFKELRDSFKLACLRRFVSEVEVLVPVDIFALLWKYIDYFDGFIMGVYYFNECVDIYGLLMQDDYLQFICDYNKHWNYYKDTSSIKSTTETDVLLFWPSCGLVQYLNSYSLQLDLVEGSHSASNWCMSMEPFLKWDTIMVQVDIMSGFNSSHQFDSFIRDEFRLMIIGHELENKDVMEKITGKETYQDYGLGYFDGLSGPWNQINNDINYCSGVSIFRNKDCSKLGFMNEWEHHCDVSFSDVNDLRKGDKIIVKIKKVLFENRHFIEVQFIVVLKNDIFCGKVNTLSLMGNNFMFGVQCTRCACVGDSVVCRISVSNQ